MSNRILSVLKEGLITKNPTFFQLLGMCPTLAGYNYGFQFGRYGPCYNGRTVLF